MVMRNTALLIIATADSSKGRTLYHYFFLLYVPLRIKILLQAALSPNHWHYIICHEPVFKSKATFGNYSEVIRRDVKFIVITKHLTAKIRIIFANQSIFFC